jgi:CHC2-type zinc finger protein/DNA primase-like protein
MSEDLDQLKQRLPLLEYLQRHNWTGNHVGNGDEFVGLCPLHPDTQPSFYVNARKNLFYCHGCQCGGDLIRFVEVSQRLSFRASVAHLKQEIALAAETELLDRTAAFYRVQLRRHPEATEYLQTRGLQDPNLIEELGIGYAPGGNLRRHLADFGYSLDLLLRTGLINSQGRDAFCRRIIFPCCEQSHVTNLYGRSIGAAFPHRLLPRSKGGLFAWESVSVFSTVILVEGLLDLAVLYYPATRHNRPLSHHRPLLPFLSPNRFPALAATGRPAPGSPSVRLVSSPVPKRSTPVQYHPPRISAPPPPLTGGSGRRWSSSAARADSPRGPPAAPKLPSQGAFFRRRSASPARTSPYP